VFEPHKDFIIDPQNQKLNLYQKTEYLKNATPSNHAPKPFLDLIAHVVGNDLIMQEEFINWLAFIVQRRNKTHTAFILHGRTGTGKGVLFTRIIQPILGHLHCPMIMMDDIGHPYNEWVETGLLVVVDEAQISDDIKQAKKRINKIKNLITEAPVILKKKYANAIQITNYINFIFTSNEHDSIWINSQDRRFKVCPRQEQPINYTEQDLLVLDLLKQDIANYLIGYPVDECRVRSIPHNAARAALIEASQNSIDEFVELIKQGNLDVLLQFKHEFLNSKNALFYGRYIELLETWETLINKKTWISTSDLRVIYSFLFSIEIGPSKFGRVLASKNISIQVKWINNAPVRAVEICWKSKYLSQTIKDTTCRLGATVN
jgi:hypothetical protein